MIWRVKRRAGFTLVEMAVVLAVMGLLLSLVLTQARPLRAGMKPHDAALELAGGLREARARAISTGHNVAFRLDLDGRRYQFDDQRPHSLPPQLNLAMLGVARGIDEDRNTGSLFFAPDGSASGGRIMIGGVGARSVVTVNWLNGLVTVADAP